MIQTPREMELEARKLMCWEKFASLLDTCRKYVEDKNARERRAEEARISSNSLRGLMP